MRSLLLGKSFSTRVLESFVLSSCQRWSIIVPFLLYLTLFTVTKFVSVPLRSDVYHNAQSVFVRRMAEKTVPLKEPAYNSAVDEEIVDTSDAEKQEPQYILEEIFHK